MQKDELLKIIQNIMELKNNKKDIINEPDDELFFYKCSILNPQSYGTMIQNRFIKRNNGIKIKSSLNKGDCSINNVNYEVKASISSINKYNVVQIRLWQPVDYILIFVNFDKELTVSICKLTHEQMEKEVEKRKQYAHGTKTANLDNKNIEYRFTLPYTESKEFIEKYFISNDLNVLEKL